MIVFFSLLSTAMALQTAFTASVVASFSASMHIDGMLMCRAAEGQ